MPREATASIRIRPETKAMLERLKRPAETYDRLVRRLIEAASQGATMNTGVGTAIGPEPGMIPGTAPEAVPTNPLEPTQPRYRDMADLDANEKRV